jgi:hypothetical protein
MLYHKFNYRLIEIITFYFKRQRTSDHTECSAAKLTVFTISQRSTAFFAVIKIKFRMECGENMEVITAHQILPCGGILQYK